MPLQVSLGNITLASLTGDLVLAPLVVGGAFAGLVVVRVVSERGFKLVVQVLAMAAAVKLLVTPWLPRDDRKPADTPAPMATTAPGATAKSATRAATHVRV